ncbi:MAG: hypothetical protein C5B55_03275 [Blastocatellia bacterium]|nr:MAG: hypothetical protein C5B55_03275 [Blastocatellia bacterium]
MAITDETKPAGLLAWKNLAPIYGMSAQEEPKFNRYTGTIEALPTSAVGHITLPRVGTSATQTEEEVRESLRRFINDWREVIGADLSQLSLVERVDDPSGSRLARYEQRPFRQQLHGEFGNLRIRFRADRSVVELFSNCIPNAERLQASLSALTPKVSAEEAAAHVVGHPITVRTPTGTEETITLPSGSAVDVKQIVVYALPASDQQSLELHLAWEIGTSNSQIKTIYLDAMTDEVIFGT